MESSGNPPRSEEPGQEQPSPPGGTGAGEDPPLPSWYRPPGEQDPQPPAQVPQPGEPPSAEPSPFRWSALPPEQPAAEEPPPVEPAPPPGPAFERPAEAEPPPGPAFEPSAEAQPPPAETPITAGAAAEEPPAEPEPADAEPEPAPTAGEFAPLAAAGAAGAAAEELPPWSRARDSAPAATPAEAHADAAEARAPPPPPPPAYPQAAVADAWTTQPDATATPRWAPRYARGDHPHVFGDRMAAGVLLTLAAASMIGGGIAALAAAAPGDLDPTIRTVICGVIAAGLLAGAVLLRFLRGSEDLRGTFAVTGIAYAAACLAFAWQPDVADPHTELVKAAMIAGLVTVLSWFAAAAVPSAVAGMIGVVSLGISAGAGVWLLVDQPTAIEVFVTAMAIGLAVALVTPRVVLLRPHPAGLGWALGGAALVVAFPAAGLMARQDPLTMAAGATASAALLAVAQRHRNLPAALGAFGGLAYLEALLVATRTGAADNSPQGTTQLIIIVIVGAVLVALVSVAAVLERRARPWPGLRRPWPVGITDLLLLAAIVLAVLSLFTGNSNVPLNPNQLSPTQSTTTV